MAIRPHACKVRDFRAWLSSVGGSVGRSVVLSLFFEVNLMQETHCLYTLYTACNESLVSLLTHIVCCEIRAPVTIVVHYQYSLVEAF